MMQITVSRHVSMFQWKWELLRRTGDGESRAVVVLALPPPDQAARVDMDTLDCLQQVRSGETSSDKGQCLVCLKSWDWERLERPGHSRVWLIQVILAIG